MNQRPLIPSMFALALFSLATNLAAQPVLHCDITYAGTTHTLDARIHNDIGSTANTDTYGAYTTEASDIAGRFVFKAVLLGTRHHLDAVKLYSYYQTERRPVLLSEVIYSAPFSYTSTPNNLTGLQHLYSPPLERELLYGCALTEDKS